MLNNRQGKVLWFQQSKGYIKDVESAEDFSFHWSDIATPDETGYYEVYPGDEVVFDIIETGLKLKATNIKRKPSISTNGKPLIKVIHMGAPKNLRVAEFNVRYLSKTQYGIKYLTSYEDKIFGSSEPISESDMRQVYNLSQDVGAKFCSTGELLSFDIIFI